MGSSAIAPKLAMPSMPVDATQRLLAFASKQAEDAVVCVTTPVPVMDLRTISSTLSETPQIVWQPPSGPNLLCAGATIEISETGHSRFRDIQDRGTAALKQVAELRLLDCDAPGPRLIGGFSFSVDNIPPKPWCDFGDARFVMPRWCYGHEGDTAWLQMTFRKSNSLQALHQRAEQFQATLDQIYRTHTVTSNDTLKTPHRVRTLRAPTPTIVSLSPPDRDRWKSYVASIHAAIDAGTCEKIVAAHSSIVELSENLDLYTTIAHLDRRYPDCFRFAYTFGSTVFLGASPERLVSKHGAHVFTGALAGSMPISTWNDPNSKLLLSSAKDRREQALVVDAITTTLKPLCDRLCNSQTPVVRNLHDVVHLETHIEGTLKTATHVLKLVEMLHPTPAVGGVPKNIALKWINNHETSRGWYAAPIGWFDRTGNGEFAVAIRSGVAIANRVEVFAGAGIVNDSDPSAEFAETQIKQRALVTALGTP